MSAEQFKVPGVFYWLAAPFVRARMLVEQRSGVFQPLEKAVLRELVAAASPCMRAALESQLNEINHATRTTAKYSEVNMYKVVGIRPDFQREALLPVPSGERRFAMARFTVHGDAHSFVAKVWSVDRRLFSIEFDQDVRSLLSVAEIAIVSIRFSSFEGAASSQDT